MLNRESFDDIVKNLTKTKIIKKNQKQHIRFIGNTKAVYL